MREIHTVQSSIFDFYSQHERGLKLEQLSGLLDKYSEVFDLVAVDLIRNVDESVGRKALSVESVFRCLLLKKQLRVTYEELAFHLTDSHSFRAFARLDPKSYPSKSALQANIRRIRAVTLSAVFDYLALKGFEAGEIKPDFIRIDSTVVKSNIAPPSDSHQLNDGIRVLCRYLGKSRDVTDVKIRFTDFRVGAKSLAYRIFNAKKAEKDELYEDLLVMSNQVIKQVDAGIEKVKSNHNGMGETDRWLEEIENYRQLTAMIMDQTQARVIDEEDVPACEKVVSLFEPHTDIIIKGQREVEYGHKVNIASDKRGFLTHVSIEEGNASDIERFIPVLQRHKTRFNKMPETVVADGGYASQSNVVEGKAIGVKRVVFHKKKGIKLSAMGIKQKTYDKLKNFRAGIEGNISELKRAFKTGKALWKGYDGFHADVWASAITYNLVRMARLQSG